MIFHQKPKHPEDRIWHVAISLAVTILLFTALLYVTRTSCGAEQPPALTPHTMELPPAVRKWFNNPDGSCVQCSIGMAGVHCNVPAATTLLWDTEYGPAERGGSGPSRVERYARERGISCWNITGDAVWDWMRWAATTGRFAAVGAGSHHFQTLYGYDPQQPGEDDDLYYVCNNNSTQKVDAYTWKQFRSLHLASGRWAVVLDCPAPAATPQYQEASHAAPLRNIPKTATKEVIRRQTSVTYTQDGKTAPDLSALNPPATDADKWFITIIADRSQASRQLLADWQSSPELLAIADPRNPRTSWAHFNRYAADDKTQEWKWAKIDTARKPVVIVQPPRSHAYGPPSTVVYQESGYRSPSGLAERICHAIATQTPARKAEDNPTQEATGPPPFITPVVDPLPPPSVYPQRTPETAPPLPDAPTAFELFYTALSKTLESPSLTNIIMLVAATFMMLKGRRKP